MVAALAFAGWYVASQWPEARAAMHAAEVRPALLLLATAIVFGTYALLIQLWRAVLLRWGAVLGFVQATRIWSISNLGRFIPGRVAQIGAMAYMARGDGVSGTAAAGSAILNTGINVAAGLLVALAAGGRLLEHFHAGARGLAITLVLLGAAGIASLPWLLPRAITLAARLLGRRLTEPPRMPWSAIWITAIGNVVAWLLYGVAFQLFVAGVLGSAAGATPAYVAVYTGSYIIGYLVLFAPGGLVFREGALIAGLTALGLATPAQATLVAVTSRLWLTLLEITPGLLFLAHDAVRRRSTANHGDAPT